MRERPPSYRIIFNWDGTPRGYSPFPPSLDQLLDIVYAPLVETQVGALFWCVGTHETTWPSQTLPQLGDAEDNRFSSIKHLHRAASLRAMWQRGEDPNAALVARGHQLGLHVFASIRMNDNHFWSDPDRRQSPLSPAEMTAVTRPGLTQLRKDHPEWCLGAAAAPRWAATSWNMAIPEVRQHLFDYIAEACRAADWDGVELDWQRHAFHLPQEDAYRLRYTLTDLQRAVRRLANEITRERGRPFWVAVRVGATLETCHRVGYDLETWLGEDLCDLVATNANSGTDPGVEVEKYLELGKDNEIQLYPGLDSHWESGAKRLISAKPWLAAWQRGLANGFYERGAHGIYIFNWHATRDSHRPLLTTLGAPETLARTNKVYAPVYRFLRDPRELRYGAERDDRLYGELPVALYPTLTAAGPIFDIPIHDNPALEARSGHLAAVELHVEIEAWAPADRIAVKLDGRPLGPPTVRNLAAENPDDPSEVDENSWLVWSLSAECAARGDHAVEICLVERDPRMLPPLVVQHVEIHIRYR